MDTTNHEAKVERRGYRFVATLYVTGGECSEFVRLYAHGGSEQIHWAEFPLRNLGDADRDEYTRVMCASIADEWMRKYRNV